MTTRRIGKTNLYIGNSNDSRDIDTLRRLGIRSIVNVAKDLEGPWFHGHIWNYKIPLYDGPGNELWQYMMAGRVVETLLNKGHKVLLHCAGGVSRSPAIGVLALVLTGIAPDFTTAYKIVRDSRRSANINPAHEPFIKEAIQKMLT